jgi:hypothetical protein
VLPAIGTRSHTSWLNPTLKKNMRPRSGRPDS